LTVENGRIVRVRAFLEREEALEAVNVMKKGPRAENRAWIAANARRPRMR